MDQHNNRPFKTITGTWTPNHFVLLATAQAIPPPSPPAQAIPPPSPPAQAIPPPAQAIPPPSPTAQAIPPPAQATPPPSQAILPPSPIAQATPPPSPTAQAIPPPSPTAQATPPPSSEPEPDVNDISDQPEEISSDQTVNIDDTNDNDMIQSVDCNTDNDVYQADNDGPKMHPLSNNVLNASELYSICNVRQTNIHKYSNGTKEQLLHVTRQF